MSQTLHFTRQKTALYTDSNRFSFSNFKHFLTLFSKFFSSFPHGTCSLSVSRKYLALEGVYLPSLRFNPEKRDSSKAYCTRQTPDDERDSHPLWCHVPNDFRQGRTLVKYFSRLQRARPKRANAFQPELFPLHSPLLRESLLVSFPPLSYMFKFSGSSCSTWDQAFFRFNLRSFSFVCQQRQQTKQRETICLKLSLFPRKAASFQQVLSNFFQSNSHSNSQTTHQQITPTPPWKLKLNRFFSRKNPRQQAKENTKHVEETTPNFFGTQSLRHCCTATNWNNPTWRQTYFHPF